MRRLRGRSWLAKIGLILLTGIIQSVTIAAVGVATDTIPPVTLTALRVGIASLAFAGLLLILRPPFDWQWRTVRDVAILGLLNVAVPFTALAVSLAFITTSLAAALFQTVPLFTVILASFLLPGERLNAIRALGTVIAVAGAVTVILGGMGAVGAGARALVGEVVIVGSALGLAVGVVYARARVRTVSTLALAAGQMFVALAILAPLALLLEEPPAAGITPQAWLATAVAGLGTPVLGYWLFYYILERFSASLAAFTGLATPLYSAVIGVFLLGEVFTLTMAVGTLLLIVGLVVLSRSY